MLLNLGTREYDMIPTAQQVSELLDSPDHQMVQSRSSEPTPVWIPELALSLML